jgi:spore photoproduct lyase
MRIYKKELRRLEKVEFFIKNKFPYLGLNKTFQITRLLYEISKKENILPESIIDNKNLKRFKDIKEYLVKKRYPYACAHDRAVEPYLPKIEIKDKFCFIPSPKKRFYPKKIFIETAVAGSYLTEKLIKNFPKAEFFKIKSLKKHFQNKKRFTIEDYNKRREILFIVKENHDFFKKCPCTKSALKCGYHIFNLGFGCIFECSYCYLQEYSNTPGIILPVNMDKFFDSFNRYKKSGMRIGTGEFSDSLMLDNITEYSISLIEFFKNHKNITFEFKTKSNNIENLLRVNHEGNIVVSWSLNPKKIIDENEFYTSSLSERLKAASKCVEAGYKIGIHFDPVFYFKTWEKEYKNLIEILFSKIKPKYIAWISIGTFRFKPELKQVIENRFPNTKILNQELLPGYDCKLRYHHNIRYKIYKCLIEQISKHSKKVPVYLCMEDKEMWENLNKR